MYTTPSLEFRNAKIKAGLALAFLLGGNAAWAQSTHEVQANDHYFQGALYGRWTTPQPVTNCGTGVGYTNVPASIGGVAYTVTSNGGVWAGYCSNYDAPGGIPAGNDAQPVDAMSLRTNRVELQTIDTPFPKGMVVALQDVDNNETVDVSFESCDGSPVLDTNGFTYVTISTDTSPSLLPNWSVSGGVWTIALTTSGAPQPAVGIQIPANVCKIVLDSSDTPPTLPHIVTWFSAHLFQPASSFVPALDVAKSVTSTGPYREGDTIGYRIIATNTGNVPLTDVSISDPNATIGTCTPAAPAALAIGEALTCEATHVVTAADISAGAVHNTAAAESTPPTVDPANPPDPVTQNSNPVTVPVGVAAVPANAPWALLLAGLGAFGLGARALRRKNLT